jgi:hypothetical protein
VLVKVGIDSLELLHVGQRASRGKLRSNSDHPAEHLARTAALNHQDTIFVELPELGLVEDDLISTVRISKS